MAQPRLGDIRSGESRFIPLGASGQSPISQRLLAQLLGGGSRTPRNVGEGFISAAKSIGGAIFQRRLLDQQREAQQVRLGDIRDTLSRATGLALFLRALLDWWSWLFARSLAS